GQCGGRFGEYFRSLRSGGCRAALRSAWVTLCLHECGVLGRRVERRENSSGTRKIALSLRDTGLHSERVHIVRHNVQNLINLPQRIGETAKEDVGKRMLGK